MIEKENFYELFSIDAWRSECGWDWNNMFSLDKDIYIGSDSITPRKIFKLLRNGYLSDYSKGKVRLDDTGFDLVIEDKNTGEPIFALRPQWPM